MKIEGRKHAATFTLTLDEDELALVAASAIRGLDFTLADPTTSADEASRMGRNKEIVSNFYEQANSWHQRIVGRPLPLSAEVLGPKAERKD